MNALARALKAIDAISEHVGRATAYLAVPMILALIYEVAARYVFGRPTIWSYEITYMIYGTHYLLGAAYTLKAKGHIRIDLLYMRCSRRTQAAIDILGYLVVFFPIMLLMVKAGYDMAADAFRIGEVSQFTPWQPLLWPFKSMICLGFILLSLQGLAEFARSLITFATGQEA